MKDELIDTIRIFITVCNELHANGKIDDQLYEELTKNKIDFLNTVENHST